MRRRLKCSFCGKDETEVEKLVVGGRKNLIGASAYICNECVSIAHDLMLAPQPPGRGPASRQRTQLEDPQAAEGSVRRAA
jgi:ATP-dependent protease Clp ATPase subunit